MSLPGYDVWKTTEPPDVRDAELQRQQVDAEERKERDWHELSALAADFVKTYGGKAMLRCVSDALK